LMYSSMGVVDLILLYGSATLVLGIGKGILIACKHCWLVRWLHCITVQIL
jgi:hypothetical protein